MYTFYLAYSTSNFSIPLFIIEIDQYLKERTHGGCNIIHLLASLAAPSRPPPSSSSSTNTGRGRTGFREMMHHALQLASTSGLLINYWEWLPL